MNRQKSPGVRTMLASNLRIALAAALALSVTSVYADIFGSGANTFAIDFVTVGNAGNANDAGAGGGIYSSPYGGVSYRYRMGAYEVTQDAITKATNLGLTNVVAGPWTGSQPAATITWFEAAAFVNFLNASKGRQAAYNLNATATALTLWSSADAWQRDGENLYRHKDAFYFLPNEDEWYKAAYHQNTGVNANYWDFATGSNTAPTAVASGTGVGTAVYNFMGTQPANVNNAGGLSPYGTMAQNGNVTEWLENASVPPNDSGAEGRTLRGGSRQDGELALRSSFSFAGGNPSDSNSLIGFRVASIPEPSSVAVAVLGFVGLTMKCRGRCRARQR